MIYSLKIIIFAQTQEPRGVVGYFIIGKGVYLTIFRILKLRNFMKPIGRYSNISAHEGVYIHQSTLSLSATM